MIISDAFLIESCFDMMYVRTFEEKVDEMLKRGEISGTVHLCVGQEACAVAICRALKACDYLVGHHRSHGHCLMKDGDPGRVMAELYGKSTGYCKGRGGSIHLINMESRYIGATGIVGAGLPIAVGAAFSLKYRFNPENAIVACVFGDGCSNEGSFHEALNLASAWELPVLFICENNQYGLYMPWNKASAVERVSDRAAAYGLPGESADGNLFEEAYQAVCKGVSYVRTHQKPMLIELRTYRYKGHSRSDPIRTYRTKEEEDQWRIQDPIKRLQTKLKGQGALSEEQWDKMVEAASRKIEAAVEFARTSPAATGEEAGRYLFSQEVE